MANNVKQPDNSPQSQHQLANTHPIAVAPSPDRVTDDFWIDLQETARSNEQFSLGAVLQSAQSLFGTLKLDELIPQLLDIILHYSGAENCFLALPIGRGMQTRSEEEWQMYPSAIGKSADQQAVAISPSPINRAEYPISLVNWVKNTRQMTCLDARQPLEMDDPYFLAHQPPSVLVLPISKSEKVLGVLYLEHSHAPNQFTPDRQLVISFLCTQAAIALENANLYQQALNSQQRYQKLSDNIPGVIYQLRLAPDGNVSFPYISPGCQNLFELSPASVIADASCLLGLMHPDDVAGYELVLIQSAQNMNFKLWEGRAILPSGRTRWIKAVSRPELQPDGSIIWDGMMLDISDRKQVEAELSKSQQNYYNLIQSVPGIVWEYDLNTDRFSFISDRAVALFGYPLEDWLSQPNFWQNLVYPDDLDTALAMYNHAIQNRHHCEHEYRLVAADGRLIWVYDISTLVCDPEGNPIATNGLFIDISDRKQVETELHQTNERLELTISELQRATQLKDEFLATMSHELRTPLNAILGMAEALQEEVFGNLNERQIQSIHTIERSGEHLLSLINDILDVSKIGAGKLQLDIAEVSPRDLCNSSLALVKSQALGKQIQLDLHFSTSLEVIAVDERRMRQVLINLLSNAVKFTPQGGSVKLSVGSISADAPQHHRGNWVFFSVRDTGIGIASKDLARLFQPFVQIDSRLNRKYEGTGLGLVLVKQIVELHGGWIDVESELGQGSCFTIYLPSPESLIDPLLKSLSLEEIIDDPEISTLPTILLAEDNEVNINTFSSYLTTQGYRMILAYNGQEAIDLAQRHHPDLMLMDIQMPKLNGLEAITRIRENPLLSGIPIIALTALVMEADREKCLATGANDYLAKPVSLKQLHHTIQKWLDLKSIKKSHQ